MDELVEVSLGDICSFKAGDAFKTNFQGRKRGDHPFIKVSDMNLEGNERIIVRAVNWVDARDVVDNRYTLHQPDSVVFAKIGIALTYNRRRILVSPTVIDNNMMAAIPKKEHVDPLYLYYLLTTVDFNIIASGSALPFLTQRDLQKISVRIHPRAAQLNVARTLGAIDEKIEVNRRSNETLESMARAIFRDWFVDFGPTRAKMNGRDPYLAPEVWETFPDRLDAETGLPEGWKLGSLGDIARAVVESVSPDNVPPETPYIGLEHMPRRSIALDSWEGAGKVGSNKSAFSRGDVLFGKLRPYFHKVGIAPLDGICSTDIVVLRAQKPNSAALLICCASSEAFVEYTNKTSEGTKMPRTSWSKMARYPLALAPEPVRHAMQAITSPLFEKITANVEASKTLAETRDVLLPRLMSGEISLREAEQTAEGAS